MKWISVKDALPQNEYDVLVFTKWGITIAKKWSGSEWVDNHLYSVCDISHWMPLPAPPNGKDDPTT